MEVELQNTLEKYPVYKDSGVEWLGDIPDGWRRKRLKYFSTLKARIGFHGLSSNDFVQEGPYCITGTDFKEGNISFDNCYHVSEYWYDLDDNIKIKNGDVLITKDGTIGKTAVVTGLKQKATLNSGVFVIRPSIDSRFLYWQLNSMVFKEPLEIISKGSTINHLYERDFNNFFFLIPPDLEQTAIANFLEEKAARIDQAIAQKEKLIALLNERKQIMIQQAVTKGLDPNVKMKESGIDWIGEIPVHWEVVANRVLFKETKRPGREGLPLLSVSIHSAVSDQELSDEDNIRGLIKIDDKSNYKYVEVNDIVFNMMRAWQGAIGAVRVEGMVSPAYIVASPNKKIQAPFFEYQYRTDVFIQEMSRNSKGITDFRKRLYWDEFKQLQTVLPPLNEQIEIVKYIDGQNSKTDKTISLQEKQIEKLREYKKVLIDSAVTGKIRVRGYE